MVILMNYISDNKIDLDDSKKLDNFITSMCDFHRKVHNSFGKEIHTEKCLNFINNFEDNIKEYARDEDEIESIEEKCSKLRENANNIKMAYCHSDPHMGNYMEDQNGSVKKVLDWEAYDYKPISYEVARIYTNIICFYDYFSSFDLKEKFDNKNSFDYNKKYMKIWAKPYQRGVINMTRKYNPVDERALCLSGSKNDLIQIKKEILDQLR